VEARLDVLPQRAELFQVVGEDQQRVVDVEQVLRLLVRLALGKDEQLLGQIARRIRDLDIETDATERIAVPTRESDRPRLRDGDVDIPKLLRGDSSDHRGRVPAPVAAVRAAGERDEKFHVQAAVFITEAVFTDRWPILAEEALSKSLALQKCCDGLALLLHFSGSGDVCVLRHERLEAWSARHGV